MRTFDDLPGERTEPMRLDENPTAARRAAPWIVLAAVVILVAGYAAWRTTRPAPVEPVAAAPPAPEASATAPAAPLATRPALALPALEASDELVRTLASRLSAHPRLAAWLANESLVRRFVAAVVNLAAGESPAPHLRFLTPSEPFRARTTAAGTTIDPASYRRYDALTELFVSLDTAGCAGLFHDLHPLLDAAYAELGYPGTTFDETLSRAIARLLAVRFPDEPLALRLKVTTYELADPQLEQRPAAEKHLLRFGPQNLARVQAKLREIAAALDLAVGNGDA